MHPDDAQPVTSQTTPEQRFGLMFGMVIFTVSLALYWCAAVYLLGLDGRGDRLERLLSRHPERFEIRWDRATAWMPGQIELRGAQFSIAGRTAQSWFRIDRGRLRIELLDLLQRRVALRSIHAEGVEFRLRRRRDPGASNAAASLEGSAEKATAEGNTASDADDSTLGLPPIPGHEIVEPAPERRGRRWLPPWTLFLDVDGVQEVERVWIEREVVEGDIELSGQATIVFRRRHFALHGSRLTLREGTWSRRLAGAAAAEGPRQVGDDLELDLRLSFAGFSPRRHPGLESLQFLSGALMLGGEVVDLEFLAPFSASVPALSGRAEGRVQSNLDVSRGRLQPGSSWRLTDGIIDASIYDVVFRGTGQAQLEVGTDQQLVGEVLVPEVYAFERGSATGETARLSAEPSSSDSATPDVASPGPIDPTSTPPTRDVAETTAPAQPDDSGLVLRLRSSAPRLGEGVDDASFELRIAPSRIDGISWLAQRFGLRAAPQVDVGRIAGHLRYDSARRDGDGDVRIELDGVQLGRRNDFGLVLDAELKGIDLDARAARRAKATLEAQSQGDSEPFRATLELGSGCIHVEAAGESTPDTADGRRTPSVLAEADLGLRVSDLPALLDVLATPAPLKWVGGLLDIRELQGTGHGRLVEGVWRFQDVRLEEPRSDRLELLAAADLTERGPQGAAFLRWRKASATVQLEPGGERSWTFANARERFESLELEARGPGASGELCSDDSTPSPSGRDGAR